MGGLGSSAPAAAAALVDPLAIVDPLIEAAGSWVHRSRRAARTAEDLVRTNPWAAAAVIAVMSLAAGYLLSQRARS